MTTFTESTVENAALTWLESLGWSIAHGPDIAPDTPGAERGDYAMRSPDSTPPCRPKPWTTLFGS